MSSNEPNVPQEARRHRPAIIAIVIALVVAVLAFLILSPGADEQNDGIATTEPPAGTTLTPAEGTDGAAEPQIAPDDAAPTDQETAPATN
ncbi:hypothetical protein JJJ17_14045 [Paracoccus caeni]|uniref:Uncharacterized protein n=1 Tax=Paracoccus caeni TaxID=657651 RepID=A0A934W0K9_9RHOB|nr:hypothetical protein [Paracoccus caeni]MBK4217050.1 hypothetical protein [Paracoccus caeni]